MRKTNLAIFTLLILVVALITAIYLKQSSETVQETPQASTQPPPPEEPIKKPIVHYPVPVASTEQDAAGHEPSEEAPSAEVTPVLPETLPEVEESDQSIQEALASLLSENSLGNLLFIENFIQRMVATVDTLPEKKIPRAHLPIKPPGGKFIVSGTQEAPQSSSRNNKRYRPYVTLLNSLDSDVVVKIYVHFYPLFQTAYEQLGYKNAYFNDRLVYVLNHLLETPDIPEPILLSQPGVLYTYADPLLEKRSAGQKVLLRIGRKNRSQVMTQLKEYKQKLTNLKF